jgi:serine/threonine-protein kinase RsbW
LKDGRAVVTIEDAAPHFDPADAPTPDLDAPLEDRAEGGLGWHLVRQFMDEVIREAVPGGGNMLTLVTHLPADSTLAQGES